MPDTVPERAAGPALGRLDAGWRSEYITAATKEERRETAAGVGVADESRCVFCQLLSAHMNESLSDEQTLIVFRGETCVVILNKYPYSSGHFMVIPLRHVDDLTSLTDAEHLELWSLVRHGTTVIQRAYEADGINVGANLGRAAGAGIPGHLHVHLVPRWNGDTNFMTTIAETRVMPESLHQTWSRLRAAW